MLCPKLSVELAQSNGILPNQHIHGHGTPPGIHTVSGTTLLPPEFRILLKMVWFKKKKWCDFLLLHLSEGDIPSCPPKLPPKLSRLTGWGGSGTTLATHWTTYIQLDEFIQPEIVIFNLCWSLSTMHNRFKTQREAIGVWSTFCLGLGACLYVQVEAHGRFT